MLDPHAPRNTQPGCCPRWVLSDISCKHEPAPTPSSTANTNLKMSSLDVSQDDLIRRSELSLGLYGSGLDNSNSLAASTSVESFRRTNSALALDKTGLQEEDEGETGEFHDKAGDTGGGDGWVVSPVLGADTAGVAGSAVKQQPWFPLGPSSSISDLGADWWRDGGGNGQGEPSSRLAVSETDDSGGASEDDDDSDKDDNESNNGDGGCLFLACCCFVVLRRFPASWLVSCALLAVLFLVCIFVKLECGNMWVCAGISYFAV